ADPKHYLENHSEAEVDSLRAHALQVPFYVAFVTAIGWAAGFALFPLTLHLVQGPLSPVIFFHFFVSFVLSGTLALTYSSIYTELVCVRGIYPQLFVETTPINHRARVELADSTGRMGIEQYLMAFTPLLGAMLILLLEHGQ